MLSKERVPGTSERGFRVALFALLRALSTGVPAPSMLSHGQIQSVSLWDVLLQIRRTRP
ncbi:hypothetical protein EAM_P203 (plasmid) [Erwinia amylovora ATCC 49946]|nr:hypothetical protein EAM_P203 [Erwinia amylovora ATCC 49946]